MRRPYGAAMRYVLRVGIPDQPGALGAVASALGSAGVDIESLEVIDREEGMAFDDVRVATAMTGQRLRTVFEAVPGVVVEALHDVAADSVTPTGLAATVTEGGGLRALVEGLPAALGATWAAAASDSAQGLQTRCASAGAPALPAGLRLPCFPLSGAVRLPSAAWMPASWRPGAARCEVAAAALDVPYAAVLVGRAGGPRFRPAELRRLAELARIAVAAEQPVLAAS